MDDLSTLDASLTLLGEIKDGAKALGIAPATLCQRAVQNGAIAKRLEAGRSVTLKTAEQIRAFIAANSATVTESGPSTGAASRNANLTVAE